jgi:hypothetical protein
MNVPILIIQNDARGTSLQILKPYDPLSFKGLAFEHHLQVVAERQQPVDHNNLCEDD